MLIKGDQIIFILENHRIMLNAPPTYVIIVVFALLSCIDKNLVCGESQISSVSTIHNVTGGSMFDNQPEKDVQSGDSTDRLLDMNSIDSIEVFDDSLLSEDCESNLKDCRFHVRLLAEAWDEESTSRECPATTCTCPECNVCVPTSTNIETVTHDESQEKLICSQILESTALAHEIELNNSRHEIESYRRQLQSSEVDLTTCSSELTSQTEKLKSLEKLHSAVEIKLKLTTNKLQVSKISDEQQKLSLEAVQLDHEIKVDTLQKEIHRLNSLLAEARASTRTAKSECLVGHAASMI
jgi:hypothetical protein